VKKKKYYSEALMVIHQDMEDLYRIGVISAERMREFDEGCLVREPDPSAEIAGAEKRSRVSLVRGQ
jgi:DNA-binding transcriptional regulator YiaG